MNATRVAVITGPRSVEVRRAKLPVVGDSDALLRIAACGVCTMEKAIFRGEMSVYPVAPGHEVAGVVEAVGSQVSRSAGLRAGDLVAVDLLTRCGACAPCRSGNSAVCLAEQGGRLEDGTRTMGAGFSDFIIAPADKLWPLRGVGVEEACMAEPLACVVHSLRRGDFDPGDRVAIVGAGFMGRLHQALLQLWGCDDVGIVEIDASRREEARQQGASWALSPDDLGASDARADLVFITAATSETLPLALQLCEHGGRIVVFGGVSNQGRASLDPWDLHRRGLSIVGAYSQEPDDWRTATAVMRSGALSDRLGEFVSARYELGEIGNALEHAADEPAYRVLVTSDRARR